MIDAILDTSVLIDLLRGFPPAVGWSEAALARSGSSTGFVSSIPVRLAVPIYTNNLKHFHPLPSVEARRPY